ncbi:MAG: N-acetyltransferase [Methylococcaceae bacterium]|nr:N-acetyltransferase [Methylococcaceae bacterium]
MKLSALCKIRKRLKQLVKDLGFVNAMLYLANRSVAVFSKHFGINKYYFVAQLINGNPLLPENRGKLLRVVELPLNEIHPCPRPSNVIKDRYMQGAVCLAAYKANEFAGCLWYAKHRFREDEVRCIYEFDSFQSVWDFDVYVEPKFRLSPVFLKLWDYASAKLLNEGYSWSFSRISAFNAMSLGSHKRMGARIVGWAVFFQVGTVQLSVSSLRPFLYVSFSEASYPVFKLKSPK